MLFAVPIGSHASKFQMMNCPKEKKHASMSLMSQLEVGSSGHLRPFLKERNICISAGQVKRVTVKPRI